MKLGVLGGSFNPPHPGHIRAAEGAAGYLGLDRVLMIPAAQPPHKSLTVGSPEPRQRLEMCREAAKNSPVIEVSDLEIARGGKSYTVDTLMGLKEMYPDDELYLLMGMDMFLSFCSWYMPEKICSLATIAAACREKKDYKRADSVAAMKSKLEADYMARVVEIPLDFIEISSTTARRLLVFGCGRLCLDGAVVDYIEKNGLYTVGANRKGLDVDALRKDVYSLLDDKRIPHVDGCEQTAVKLAKLYGQDENKARRAAILHDVTKALKSDNQLILAKRYDIMSDVANGDYSSVRHAMTAAAVAKYVYGEGEQVCGAIKWHTTGKAAMTTLEKIIYLADFIEPTRDFDGVDHFRQLALEDLDECLRQSLKHTLTYLEAQGKPIHPATRQAYEYISGNR